MNIREDLLYTKEHEWIKVKEDCVYIGITEYAQNELGDIIFVEMPEIGDKFNVNDVFGTIEAVKTVADLFTPVKIEVIEINEVLDNEPEKINTDSYDSGWIIKGKILDEENLNNLLSCEDYKKIINND